MMAICAAFWAGGTYKICLTTLNALLRLSSLITSTISRFMGKSFVEQVFFTVILDNSLISVAACDFFIVLKLCG